MRAILLAVLLAACAPPKAGDTLGESVRSYNDGVRWQRYDNAAIHVPAAERSQFIDDADERAGPSGALKPKSYGGRDYEIRSRHPQVPDGVPAGQQTSKRPQAHYWGSLPDTNLRLTRIDLGCR